MKSTLTFSYLSISHKRSQSDLSHWLLFPFLVPKLSFLLFSEPSVESFCKMCILVPQMSKCHIGPSFKIVSSESFFILGWPCWEAQKSSELFSLHKRRSFIFLGLGCASRSCWVIRELVRGFNCSSGLLMGLLYCFFVLLNEETLVVDKGENSFLGKRQF